MTKPDMNKDLPEREPEYIRVRFGDGETGWACKAGDNLARICNVPLEDTLNMDDVVRLERRDGWNCIAEIVKRKFKRKTAIAYPGPAKENYKKLAEAAKAKGWVIEGMVPGMAICAHPAGTSAQELSDETGVAVALEILMEDN